MVTAFLKYRSNKWYTSGGMRPCANGAECGDRQFPGSSCILMVEYNFLGKITQILVSI